MLERVRGHPLQETCAREGVAADCDNLLLRRLVSTGFEGGQLTFTHPSMMACARKAPAVGGAAVLDK